MVLLLKFRFYSRRIVRTRANLYKKWDECGRTMLRIVICNLRHCEGEICVHDFHVKFFIKVCYYFSVL